MTTDAGIKPEWVQVIAGNVVCEHRDGIPWHKAEVPSRFHRCKIQTRFGEGGIWEYGRCACGSTYFYRGDFLIERNSRRKLQGGNP